mmetsp:Transcript_26549/g.52135  ORF Transcript_26549/g.52135 Transcript_26549/m.52135 type:complete len:93 (-) Transcript_26549:923-1201(-)
MDGWMDAMLLSLFFPSFLTFYVPTSFSQSNASIFFPIGSSFVGSLLSIRQIDKTLFVRPRAKADTEEKRRETVTRGVPSFDPFGNRSTIKSV